MTIRRRFVWIAGVLLLASAVVASAAYYKHKRAVPAVQFTVSPVQRGDIVQAVATTGQLTPLVSVEVSSQISGLVTEVKVDFNSKVRKGQVLAKIDPATYEQKLRQAQADLEAAEANFRLTELDARRSRSLREQDLITQQEYDRAEAQLQQAQAGLLTRKATVENARLDLERCTLTSPIDGVVIFKQVEVGKTVAASLSAPTLFVIARDMSRMRIIAPVSEVDVWSVHPGQPVTFTVDALPGRRFSGTLTQLRNPYTPSEKQTQQSAQQSAIAYFDAVIEVDNSDLLLRPSLTANVSIVVSRRQDVLRIPNGALRMGPAQSAAGPSSEPKDPSIATVYRLPGGDRNAIPEAVQVRLGITDSLSTEVIEGLKETDVVITGVPAAARDRPTMGRRGLLF